MKNSYIESEEIRKYKIETDNLDEEVMALRGYYYWHCPRCKKIMDSDNNGFVHRCLNCDQAVKYSDKPKTPTLSRMLEVQDDSKLCGEFLDFILSKYTILRTQRLNSFRKRS